MEKADEKQKYIIERNLNKQIIVNEQLRKRTTNFEECQIY